MAFWSNARAGTPLAHFGRRWARSRPHREPYFFLTLKDGLPVSYRCLSTLIHPGVVGFIRLRPDQIFMVDEFTVPAFRRLGLTRQMAIAMTPVLISHGFVEVLGIHRTDNDNTIAAAHAKGIPRIGTITRSCLLWRTSFCYEPNGDHVVADTRIAQNLPDGAGPIRSLSGVTPLIDQPLARREVA